jgi:integrase
MNEMNERETETLRMAESSIDNRLLAIGDHVEEPNQIAALTATAREYASQAKSSRTRAIYRQEWLSFASWADSRGLASLPAEPRTVALYLTDQASRRKVAGLTLALSAISQGHRAAGLESPRGHAEVREVLAGIRRAKGTAQRQVAPVTVNELRSMVNTLPVGLQGLRDRALLLVGFGAALRRSELVALRIEDVAFTQSGLEVVVRRSKVDQEARGTKLGVGYGSDPSTCPVRALQAWLNASAHGLVAGPLFRSVRPNGDVLPEALTPQSVALVVKRVAKVAGLNSARFSGHSLRAGLATSAIRAGKGEASVMRQGRWSSVTMMRRYVREASLWQDNATTGIGL